MAVYCCSILHDMAVAERVANNHDAFETFSFSDLVNDMFCFLCYFAFLHVAVSKEMIHATFKNFISTFRA